MRKWAFLVSTAAAVAVIGCGGGGGGGTSSGGGGGNGGGTPSSVNLPATPGLVMVDYLTGQGRGPSGLTAVVNNITLVDTNSQIVNDPLSTSLQLGLNSYTSQIGTVDVPVSVNSPSRAFNQFNLQIYSLGGFTGPSNADAIDYIANANFLVETGRQTLVPIYLDDAMCTLDGTNTPQFDENLFKSANYDPIANEILGFFSDYVMFDISAMPTADKPTLSTGAVVNRVYFSGDNLAVSESGSSGRFEVLTPTGIIAGQFSPPAQINTVAADGQYQLLVNDPTDLTNTIKIASYLGIYRDFTSVIANASSFEMIVFPNSEEDLFPDCAIVKRDGAGNITALYFGGVDYQAGTLDAFPVSQIVSAGLDGEITGTITDFKDNVGASVTNVTTSEAEAAIRSGTYTFSGTVPSGFPPTGRFIVFRADGTDSSLPFSRMKTHIARPQGHRK